MKNKIKKFIQFIKKDIWAITDNDHSFFKSLFIKQLKIVLLAIHKFNQKNGRLQAASMTYYSILALVPSMTLIYGLMTGFGLEKTLRTELYRYLSSQQQLVDALFNLAQSYVENSHENIFAGIGVALLLWSVFKTLTTIENAFNDIWGIKEQKPILRKLSDYLAVFIICPLLLILSGSLTVFVSTQVSYISTNILQLGPLDNLIYIVLFFLPFLVIWMVFTFIYIFMPNTQVNFLSGLWGGLVAGSLYQIAQWAYVIFQVWITRSNAIYGSLAALPLFLVWLQVSWMILLFGAEVAFARQYLKTYAFEFEDLNPSPRLRKLAALAMMYICVKNFEQGKDPWTVQQMAEHLHLPARLSQEVAFDLVKSGLLSQIHVDESKTLTYQPARTINTITAQDVIEALEHLGQEEVTNRESPELKIVHNYLNKLNDKIRRSGENVLLKDL